MALEVDRTVDLGVPHDAVAVVGLSLTLARDVVLLEIQHAARAVDQVVQLGVAAA